MSWPVTVLLCVLTMCASALCGWFLYLKYRYMDEEE